MKKKKNINLMVPDEGTAILTNVPCITTNEYYINEKHVMNFLAQEFNKQIVFSDKLSF